MHYSIGTNQLRLQSAVARLSPHDSQADVLYSPVFGMRMGLRDSVRIAERFLLQQDTTAPRSYAAVS